MINTEGMNKKELREIIDIQIEHYGKRIAELEKELGFTYEKAIKDVKAHNLEQQQLAITRFANKYCGECTSDYQVRLSGEASLYVEYLEVLKELTK